MTTKYKVSIISFSGEGESLKAQQIYEQTVEGGLNVKAVIDAVNADAPLEILTNPAPAHKRAPRSDRGKKRVLNPASFKAAQEAFTQ